MAGLMCGAVFVTDGHGWYPAQANTVSSKGDIVSRLEVVDCLLPARVRQLGRFARYSERRRPARLSAGECETRGGEYIIHDRGSLAASFDTWMPLAMGGDANAQLIVGELAERGREGVPDYEMAKLWYSRAAEQKNAAAMFNLARLYEQGLGVGADQTLAAEWYRKAYGIDPAELGNTIEFADLKAEVETLRTKTADLEQALAKALAERDQLKAELEQREAALREAQTTYAATTENLASARRESAATYTAYEKALAALATTQNELARERAKLANKEAALDAERKVLEDQRSDLSRSLDKEVQSIAALEAQSGELDVLRAQLDEERARVQSLLAERDAARAASREASNNIGALEQSLTQKLADLSKREQALAEREAALLAQQADQKAEIDDTAATLAARNDRFAADQAALSEQREALAKQREALTRDLASLGQQRDELSKREVALADVEMRLGARQTSLQNRETALIEREQALNARAQDLAAADNKKAEALAAAQREREHLVGQLAGPCQ